MFSPHATAPSPRRPFLTAAWRYLVMLNYEIDPLCLAPFVPQGTTLDYWQDQALVSIVGFRFLDTRVAGRRIPWHRNFDEVNLRFYVRRECPDGTVRRGVTFIREFVPSPAIALVARAVYNEPYHVARMRHTVPPVPMDTPGRITYEWRTNSRWQRIAATTVGTPGVPAPESETAFIIEHYWGYTAQQDGSTIEYEVTHPPWRVWEIQDSSVVIDVHTTYGPAFTQALSNAPRSTFVAEGSPVVVHRPRYILPVSGR